VQLLRRKREEGEASERPRLVALPARRHGTVACSAADAAGRQRR